MDTERVLTRAEAEAIRDAFRPAVFDSIGEAAAFYHAHLASPPAGDSG